MKFKHTKKALLFSLITIIVALAMMAGTTFAWFTDSVTSSNNLIVAGNLDVEMYYQNQEVKSWTKVEETTNVFKKDALWEPGHTEVVKLQISNEGTLALKYKLGINVVDETGSTNSEGEFFKLSEHIRFGVISSNTDNSAVDYTRKMAIAAVEDVAKPISEGFNTENIRLESRNNNWLTLVVYMPTTVGNEVKAAVGAPAPSINIGLSLVATQATFEEDTFGDDYDEGADLDGIYNHEVTSIAEAQAKLAECTANETVSLSGVTSGDFVIPAYAKATLKLNDGVVLNSIRAEGNARIEISGDVKVLPTSGNAISAVGKLVIKGDKNSILTAIGNNSDNLNGSGSGITATRIEIDGISDFTALGYGDHAYGIGGDVTELITVSNTKITNVAGGHVQPTMIKDPSYGKSEPEGGAAIGSGRTGAVINLYKTEIVKADGGSKSAAIGARYHTGVIINITDCVITEANGGNASAGIGGSRVENGDVADNININIIDSTVNAKGGDFAAGIGMGYNTHCNVPAEAPICTIYIRGNSVITAQGGKYGAGIGTGYHTANLMGGIENSVTVNATAGESREGKYTKAMDVGFGVIDHSREANETNLSTFNYKGTVITVASAELNK